MPGFSRSGLVEQLEFAGYSTKDAAFAGDHLNVDWNEQAARSAEDYVSMSGFSRSGLIEQLEYEGYTRQQADTGPARPSDRRVNSGGTKGHLGGQDPSEVPVKPAALRFASASQTSALTETRGWLIGSYGTTWSFPLLHNGSCRSCRGDSRKTQESFLRLSVQP